MKKSVFLATKMYLLVAVVIALSACAISNSTKWPDNSHALKGKTMEEISAMYGEPYQKYTVKGIKVWEYRRPAEKRNGLNTLVAVCSFGLVSGGDSTYVDILRVCFRSEKVIKTSLEENVIGVAASVNSMQTKEDIVDGISNPSVSTYNNLTMKKGKKSQK